MHLVGFITRIPGKPADLIPHLLEVFFTVVTIRKVGTAVAQLLRCCATSWKFPGSIPAGFIRIFH